MKEMKNIILYASPNGTFKLEVSIDGETVWLSQKQMGELFDCTSENVIIHLKNIFESGELVEKATTKESLVVQKEGNRSVKREIRMYNLDAIISLGYRVNSIRGTQFRIWATNRLREYIIKGFTLDDERLKNGKKESYFDELIERVRAIRTSERNFYQKITDIYATSLDYDPKSLLTKNFFATVQNKMHYGIHGHTAAEVIVARADAKKPNMGITSVPQGKIKRNDVFVAKNYLTEDEIYDLNLIVDQYLSFAEMQARKKKPMQMEDWIHKLDDFLKLNEKEILKTSGKISKETAELKAGVEYDKFKKEEDKKYISDFDEETKKYLNGKTD
ncbi:MAG: hypothetical protein A3B11_02220 [Candidatus Taylorbacteria bacterium RIFCSPLOWO2_01_FULL_44_26]|uniref:Cell filamentation protein Fic n=2 Tax=Candidatus Tayloriibacteriota TaxID=1817919 RepID=A0A1G2MK93_9BACT|nr:MAG: hypothetical protein A3D50_02345 [Candidatus Taylorbacteria bacterium RIFCSPHIGHO2_02_FULL_44_12]OHA30780.1 MAG: hypothetical protein A3B11_02220 [Candidatus Taylorbacteria bacterium RIFCSPLOWO2_01_FULL_44_26]